MLLAARRAAVEVRAHPGHRGVGIATGGLEVDVLVESLEARVAVDLEAGGPEQRGHDGCSHVIVSPGSTSLRRRVRASCSVL